jgi:probable phosphoglycerate mutase
MPKSPDIELVLVRCARTAWDEAARLQGDTDMPASPDGLKAACQALDELLGDRPPDISTVYTAPDEASRQTADYLAKMGGGRVKPTDNASPMDLGVWEGLTEAQLVERYPSAYKQWRTDPSLVSPPEGATFLETELALLKALARASERAGTKSIAFVLRPLEYGIARCALAGKPTTELWNLVEDGPLAVRNKIGRSFLRTRLEARKASA